jgi:predicted dienelactone hydrolase
VIRWLFFFALSALLAAGETASDIAEVDKLYLLDDARGRNLGVKVYYPLGGAGPLPVVLFSHGLGGSQWGYAYLGRHLAAHGFISIHCTHPGSDWLLWDGKGPGMAMLALRKAACDSANLRDRPRDLSFLIDHFDELARQAPALAGRLDAGRIAIAGHSFGAYTALALAGLKPTLPDGPVDFADPRPRAFIAMSPQGSGGFQPAGCWAGITGPVLLITGTEDEQPFSGSGHGLAWRLEAWQGIPEGAKYLLVLDGATHMTFSAGGMGEKADPPRLEAVCTAVTAFLEAQLGGCAFVPPSILGGTWTPAPAQ